jgi:hypothetical protein
MEGVTPKKEKWEHHLLHFNAIMVTNVESIILTSEPVSRVSKGWTAEDLQAFSAASGEKQLLANKYLLELQNLNKGYTSLNIVCTARIYS